MRAGKENCVRNSTLIVGWWRRRLECFLGVLLILILIGVPACSGSGDPADSTQGANAARSANSSRTDNSSQSSHSNVASEEDRGASDGTPQFRQADLATVDWAPFESGQVEPAERFLAPQFTLQSVEGRPVSLGSFRGKVVLVNFWATWCGPCRKEIPDFIAMSESYPDDDFVVLGVSMDREGLAKVQPFVRGSGITYPILIGGPRISPLYGNVSAIPTTFVIDKRGRIAARSRGYQPRAHFEGIVQRLIAES